MGTPFLSNQEKINTLDFVLKEFTGLLALPADLRQQLIQSGTNRKIQDEYYLQDNIYRDSARKIEKIFDADSLAQYLKFYKSTHRQFENEYQSQENELVVNNPNPLRINKLQIFIGGSEFPAYKRRVELPGQSVRRLHAVKYSIFIENSAVASLLDICNLTEPKNVFSNELFLKNLSTVRNLGKAIRANYSMLDVKACNERIEALNLSERVELFRMIEKSNSGPTRNPLKHISVRRALLLFKVMHPNDFSPLAEHPRLVIKALSENEVPGIPDPRMMRTIIKEMGAAFN